MTHTYHLGALVRALPNGYTLAHESEHEWRIMHFNPAASTVVDAGTLGNVHVIHGDPSIFEQRYMYPEDAIGQAIKGTGAFIRQDPNQDDQWLGEMIRALPVGWSLAHLLSGRWRCANMIPSAPGTDHTPFPKQLHMGDGDKPEGALVRARNDPS